MGAESVWRAHCDRALDSSDKERTVGSVRQHY